MVKPRLSILALGPEDSGKSTLLGHLLYKCGSVAPGMMARLWQQKEDRAWTYSQILESFASQWYNCESFSKQKRFYWTPKYEVTIANTPSCSGVPERFPPNSDQTACVLLVVSALEGDFEASWDLIQKQVHLACKLQAQQIVVCVNKMDSTRPPYHRQRYEDISGTTRNCFQELGQDPSTVVFLPISALCGDNLQRVSLMMPWFRGWEIMREDRKRARGLTLEQLLDSIPTSGPRWGVPFTHDAWTLAEEKILLSVWKSLACPSTQAVPSARRFSKTLVKMGIQRSPDQCRRKADHLMKRYRDAQLQGGAGRCPHYWELRDILGDVASPRKSWQEPEAEAGGACGTDPGGSPAREAATPGAEEPLAPPGPPGHQKSLLAGLGSGLESPARARDSTADHALDLLASSKCLGPPSRLGCEDLEALPTGRELRQGRSPSRRGGRRAVEQGGLPAGGQGCAVGSAPLGVSEPAACVGLPPAPPAVQSLQHPLPHVIGGPKQSYVREEAGAPLYTSQFQGGPPGDPLQHQLSLPLPRPVYLWVQPQGSPESSQQPSPRPAMLPPPPQQSPHGPALSTLGQWPPPGLGPPFPSRQPSVHTVPALLGPPPPQLASSSRASLAAPPGPFPLPPTAYGRDPLFTTQPGQWHEQRLHHAVPAPWETCPWALGLFGTHPPH